SSLSLHAHTGTSPLPLHDALPIWSGKPGRITNARCSARRCRATRETAVASFRDKLISNVLSLPAPTSATRLAFQERSTTGVTKRSEEHTSELQSRGHLVCRLLLEK